jgi:hypothetical protein
VLVVAGLAFVISCGPLDDSRGPLVDPKILDNLQLQPPEVFNWTDLPIEFAPPPQSVWSRHRNQGAVEGVRYQIARFPPGRIEIGHYRSLHRSHSRRSLASGVEKRFDPPPPGFTLADVLDRVRFDPRDMPKPETVTVEPEVERTVGGYPAVGLDYTWDDGRNILNGREVYVLVDEHLFVATVLGKRTDISLFERIVATIRFPSLESSS